MNWNIIESGIKHHNLHQWNLGSQYDKLVIVESGVKHPLPLFAMQLFTPESTVSKTDELLQGTDKCWQMNVIKCDWQNVV
jgi:hypothetical protein